MRINTYWTVRYEHLQNDIKIADEQHVDTEDEALLLFDKIYNMYEHVIITIYDPNVKIIQSCTKGYR